MANIKIHPQNYPHIYPYIFISVGRWPSGSYCILANGNCPSGFSRSHGYMRAVRMYATSSAYMKQVYFGDSKIICHGSCVVRGDLYITACCK